MLYREIEPTPALGRFVECFWILENDAGTAATQLIRDFREFARQTPTLLFENSSALTEAFTRKYRVSHFSNTPA
jgi:hypothetical protein